VKVGDLVRHKNPKFPEHEGVHLVTFAGELAFTVWGSTGYQSRPDWEVINAAR